jgi:hypothetical protein
VDLTQPSDGTVSFALNGDWSGLAVVPVARTWLPHLHVGAKQSVSIVSRVVARPAPESVDYRAGEDKHSRVGEDRHYRAAEDRHYRSGKDKHYRSGKDKHSRAGEDELLSIHQVNEDDGPSLNPSARPFLLCGTGGTVDADGRAFRAHAPHSTRSYTSAYSVERLPPLFSYSVRLSDATKLTRVGISTHLCAGQGGAR